MQGAGPHVAAAVRASPTAWLGAVGRRMARRGVARVLSGAGRGWPGGKG